MDFNPHEMSGEIRRLSQNLRTKYAKPENENHHLLTPWRSGAVRLKLGFKKKNVYKVEQDV